MALLFEFHNEVEIDNPIMLKAYLNQVWNEQYAVLIDKDENSEEDDINQKR